MMYLGFVAGSLLAIICAVCGDGRVSFLQYPQSIKFKGDDVVDKTGLEGALSTSQGFSVIEPSDWNGMQLNDPFNFAESLVILSVDGVSSLGYLKGHTFPLSDDVDEDELWHDIKERIELRFPDNPVIIREDFTRLNVEGNIDTEFGTISVNPNKVSFKKLDTNVDEDKEFLSSLSVLDDIAQKIQNGALIADGTPDLFYFNVGGLRSLIDQYGKDSAVVTEAKSLLTNTLNHLSKSFAHAYKGKCLVVAISTENSLVRPKRSLKIDSKNVTDLNLSKNYDPDYPVIFNILLWFMIAFTFSIIAVAVGIASMDPGRDSIIYRMTSNRMKKDN